MTTKLTLIEEVSQDLKIRFRGTASALTVTPPGVTVVELSDMFSDALAPMAAYISKAGGVTFRRIADFVSGGGVLSLNRNPTGVFANSDLVDTWLILTPADWREIVDDAVQSLYKVERITVPPVSGQSEYDLTALASWLLARKQVHRVLWRWSNAGWTEEEDAPSFKIIENLNAIKLLLLGDLPADLTSLSIIVEARHFYDKLATDATAITCPEQLARAQVRVEALNRIWTTMGEKAAKDLFASERDQAERLLLNKKKQLVDQAQPVPIHVERSTRGPDLPMQGYRW